jgi:uncharacterized protein YsxB (DUF464 family)
MLDVKENFSCVICCAAVAIVFFVCENELEKTLKASQKLNVMANFWAWNESVTIEIPLSPTFQKAKEKK